MYVGILRVHDANRCPPLRKILKDPCNRSQKDRRAATYKKTPLSFDIGKTTVFHTASLRLFIFLRGTFVQMSEQSCCMSEQSCCVSSGASKQGTFATRESFSIF